MNEMLKDSNYHSDFIEMDAELYCKIVSSDLSTETNLKLFSVKYGCDLILFTSHTPCGDASIIPKQNNSKRDFSQVDENESGDGSASSKKAKLNEIEDDLHRTGAKCVPNSSVQDPKEKGLNYHCTGVVRLKPG